MKSTVMYQNQVQIRIRNANADTVEANEWGSGTMTRTLE
jgi:hypothetical protein